MEQKAPKAKQYVITTAEGKPATNVEIVGLPIKVTAANVNEPNVVAAIANFEARTKRTIFGKYVRLA